MIYNYNKLTPFKKYIIQNFPYIDADFDSLNNYGLYCKVVEYLNKVIDSTNNQNEFIEELTTAFNNLHDYVEDYFNNLDVQDEINNKLDQMAEDGTLTTLINRFLDPIVTTQNNKISQIENTVNSVASGSPAGVYDTVQDLTSADPNHSKIYLVKADGKWYYYNTSTTSWVAGGVYQATQITYDTTLTINQASANAETVGKKINNIVATENLLDIENCLDEKIIYSNGTINDNSAFFVSNIFHVNQGDTLISQYYNENGESVKKNISSIVKVQADGTFITLINNNDAPYWLADEDCFVRLNCPKYSATPLLDHHMVTLNTPTNKLLQYGYKLIETNEEIDQISKYDNLFDIEDYAENQSIDVNGNFVVAQHYFTTNLIKVENGDIIYTKYHDNNVTNVKIANVFKYDENMHIIGRSSVNNANYTASHNGYVKFTCANPNDSILNNKFTISKNEQLSSYLPHKRYIIPNNDYTDVRVDKVNETNYIITFGKFKVTLFKTVDEGTNSNNWNIKDVRDVNDNIIVPTGTDIIGPVKINNNSDFIGGIHGDETTNFITISINNTAYNLSDITSIGGDSITLNIKSTCYDQDDSSIAFQRYITIIFTKNKMHIWNNYKASKNLTLKRATNGGLIACKNNIIKDIMFNSYYFATPPTTTQNINSKYNTNATINTIYGSVTVNNIKGYMNDNYEGYLQVFTNENPIRCKIYFDTYKQGNYEINNGDIIIGEFEYLLS